MDRFKLLDAGLRAFDARMPDVTPSLCVATRYRSSTCRWCLDVCPAGAIATSPWLELDAEKCSSCGACASVCRTGALSLELQHHALRDECRSRVSSGSPTGEPAVMFACRLSDPVMAEAATCVMSCLGGLSAADLLAAAAHGAERIDLVSGECAACADGAAEAALELAVTTAAETMVALSRPLVVARTRLAGSASAVEATAPAMSRRGLFRYLARGLGQAAAGGTAPKDPQRSIGTLHRQVAPPTTHRRLILDLVELHARGGRSAVTLPAALPLASLLVAPECDTCGLCISYCPHGALVVEGASVACDAGRCTGCGLCTEVCPRSALRIGPVLLTPRRSSETQLPTPSATR
jgi:ferredoxin